MGAQLSLSVIEFTILMLGAIVLGFTIHFFVFSRRSWREMKEALENKKNPTYAPTAANKLEVELANWKSRFFDELDLKNKLVDDLKKQLASSEENVEIYTIEAEETKIINKQLKAEIAALKTPAPQPLQPDYFKAFTDAEHSLFQQYQRIEKMLGQIDTLNQPPLATNTNELLIENEALKNKLSLKEKEVENLRLQTSTNPAITSLQDNAFAEFNDLQQKIENLEAQLATSKKISLAHCALQEEQVKLNRDIEALNQKCNITQFQNKQLRAALMQEQEKLAEASFQRELLQRKIAFLENLNTDMNAIAASHKKLEAQIKRMGELESRLNLVSEERDRLAKQKLKSV
jgi:chromosome segregation ATPase